MPDEQLLELAGRWRDEAAGLAASAGHQGGAGLLRERMATLEACAIELEATLPDETSSALLLGKQPHDPEHCDRGGRPHTGPCADPEMAGFSDDPHPIGALMADPAPPCVRWTWAGTRIDMIGLLRVAALLAQQDAPDLTVEALGDLADAVLAQMPEAGPDPGQMLTVPVTAELAEKDAAISRVMAENAELRGLLILAREGAFRS